jgi:hypothetical protein
MGEQRTGYRLDMTTTPSPNEPFDPGVDTREAPDDMALEDEDVALPGDPEFDDTHELLTGADADPPPGATAG